LRQKIISRHAGNSHHKASVLTNDVPCHHPPIFRVKIDSEEGSGRAHLILLTEDVRVADLNVINPDRRKLPQIDEVFRVVDIKQSVRKDPSVLQFIENVDPEFQSPLLLHFGQKSPYIPIHIENKTVPFLIGTGAAVSVLQNAIKPLQKALNPQQNNVSRF